MSPTIAYYDPNDSDAEFMVELEFRFCEYHGLFTVQFEAGAQGVSILHHAVDAFYKQLPVQEEFPGHPEKYFFLEDADGNTLELGDFDRIGPGYFEPLIVGWRLLSMRVTGSEVSIAERDAICAPAE